MWACPECGRTFANRNQTHTCAPLGNLDDHFTGKDPAVRAAFDRVLEIVGPVTVLPEKTRIALHVRMSFAAFVLLLREAYADGSHLDGAKGAAVGLRARAEGAGEVLPHQDRGAET